MCPRISIVALTDAAGANPAINRYDEFGIPQSTNSGRFGYTGQAWLKEIGLNYYKTRMYRPGDGVFMQPDLIGYLGGPNLYAYVLNDPINFVDPLGLDACVASGGTACPVTWPGGIVVIGTGPGLGGSGAVGGSGSFNGLTLAVRRQQPEPTPLVADRRYCAGYEAAKTAQQVLGSAGDGAGILEDIMARTPANYAPQGRAFMISLKAMEGLGLGGSAAVGLWLGYRYGDWAGFGQGLNDALAGSAFAAGYRKLVGLVGEGGAKADLVADIAANVLPRGVTLESSGVCAR